jgi:hypothetical protein
MFFPPAAFQLKRHAPGPPQYGGLMLFAAAPFRWRADLYI